MLLKSSVLIWAIVQVLIYGSQCNPRAKRQSTKQWDTKKVGECIRSGTQMGVTYYGGTTSGVECKKWCTDIPGCKSIDYRPHSEDKECRLSSDGSSEPCYGTGTEFSAIKTVKWKPSVIMACIKTETKMGETLYGGTTSGVECKKWCEEKPGCKSIDYRPQSVDKECRLSSDGSSQPCDLRRTGTVFSAIETDQGTPNPSPTPGPCIDTSTNCAYNTASCHTSSCQNGIIHNASQSFKFEWTPSVINACIIAGTKMGETLYGGTTSGVECQKWCEEKPGCKSIDYRPHSVDKECRLSSDGSSEPCDLRRTGTEFSSIV